MRCTQGQITWRTRARGVENGRVLVDLSDSTLSEADRRELVWWTVACVTRLLPIFEAARPNDGRLADALAGALAFSRGELGVGAVRKLAFSCHAAAREAEVPAVVAVARACGQAVAVAHMAGHARQVPAYTVKTLTDDPVGRDAELRWQRSQLPQKFERYVYMGS